MRTRGTGQGSASGTEFANRGKKKNGKSVCELRPIYTTEKTGSGPIKKWS